MHFSRQYEGFPSNTMNYFFNWHLPGREFVLIVAPKVKPNGENACRLFRGERFIAVVKEA